MLLTRRYASRCGGLDFEKLVERMPEDAASKSMFRNIGAIRESTDLIPVLLE